MIDDAGRATGGLRNNVTTVSAQGTGEQSHDGRFAADAIDMHAHRNRPQPGIVARPLDDPARKDDGGRQ